MNFMNLTADAKSLNFYVSRFTAFSDSADLRAALERGYTPTLRTDAYTSEFDRGIVEALRTHIIRAGFKVHPAPAPHSEDAHCAPYLVDGECSVCGVTHVEPCAVCGSSAYHRDGCSEVG